MPDVAPVMTTTLSWMAASLNIAEMAPYLQIRSGTPLRLLHRRHSDRAAA
jgi:hypothetical protein